MPPLIPSPLVFSAHAMTRCQERAGFKPSLGEIREIEAKLQGRLPGATRLAHLPRRPGQAAAESWLVVLRGQPLTLVFCPLHAVVLTVKPPGWGPSPRIREVLGRRMGSESRGADKHRKYRRRRAVELGEAP